MSKSKLMSSTYFNKLVPLTVARQSAGVAEENHIATSYRASLKPGSKGQYYPASFYGSPFNNDGKTLNKNGTSTCTPEEWPDLKLRALEVCGAGDDGKREAYKATIAWLKEGMPKLPSNPATYKTKTGMLKPVDYFWGQTTVVINTWRITHEKVEKAVNIQILETEFNLEMKRINGLKVTDKQKEKKAEVAFKAFKAKKDQLAPGKGPDSGSSPNSKLGNGITIIKAALQDDKLVINPKKGRKVLSYDLTKDNPDVKAELLRMINDLSAATS